MRRASSRSGIVWLGVGFLLGSLPVLAQEASRPTEDSGPYVRVMTGPLERVESVAKELGLPLPPFLRRDLLEAKLPFIGPGGLRGTGSLGLWVGASSSGSDTASPTFFLPVQPNPSTPKGASEPGATPAPSTGIQKHGESVYRRMDGYILMSRTQEDLIAASPEASQDFSSPGLLARLDLDFARWRAADPATFNKIMNSRASIPTQNQSRLMGRAFVTHLFTQVVKRMHCTLLDAAPALRLRVALEPLAPGETTPFPKPAFPAESVGRLDITYSSAETSRWVSGLMELILASAERDGAFDAAARSGIRTGQARSLFQKAFDVLFVADSVSVAVEPFEGNALYHQVNQYRTPGNFTARLNAVLKDFKAADRKTQAPKQRSNTKAREPLFKVSTYPAGNARITRVSLSDDLTLDFVDSGTSVRLVIANDQEHHLPPALLKAPAEGSISSIFAGTIEPSAVASGFSAVNRSLSPATAVAFAGLRGQRISWETHAEGEAAVVEIDVPKPFVRAFYPSEEAGAPSKSAVSSVPDRPRQGQRRAPCSKGEETVNGACWHVFKVPPDECTEKGFVRDGRCYEPVMNGEEL